MIPAEDKQERFNTTCCRQLAMRVYGMSKRVFDDVVTSRVEESGECPWAVLEEHTNIMLPHHIEARRIGTFNILDLITAKSLRRNRLVEEFCTIGVPGSTAVMPFRVAASPLAPGSILVMSNDSALITLDTFRGIVLNETTGVDDEMVDGETLVVVSWDWWLSVVREQLDP